MNRQPNGKWLEKKIQDRRIVSENTEFTTCRQKKNIYQSIFLNTWLTQILHLSTRFCTYIHYKVIDVE